jgi:hypothetical protein
MPSITVLTDGYRMTQGEEHISIYEAPILYGPPAYHSTFCSGCGSPVPDPHPAENKLEIPAGLLDEDPGLKPDKHIFIELIPAWDKVSDHLPQYDLKRLSRERQGIELPEDFKIRTHDDNPSKSEPGI